MLITLIVLGFKILPLGISLDGDLGELNSNVLSFITFVYFKSVPLAKHQSVVVANGP